MGEVDRHLGSGLTRRRILGGGALFVLGWATALAVGHRPLAAGSRSTLGAALEALLPEGAPVDAICSDVEAFLAAGDPVVLGELTVALRVLEHGAGPGFGSFSRFSRMSRAARSELLEDWRSSSLATKRRIADALRRIALFSYYTRAETWPALGYDGPWVGR